MMGKRTTHGPAAREHVRVQSAFEIDYWCKRLHCTAYELTSAVHAVGTPVDVVREHLADRRTREGAGAFRKRLGAGRSHRGV